MLRAAAFESPHLKASMPLLLLALSIIHVNLSRRGHMPENLNTKQEGNYRTFHYNYFALGEFVRFQWVFFLAKIGCKWRAQELMLGKLPCRQWRTCCG